MALPRSVRGPAQDRFLPSETSAEFRALSFIASALKHPQRSLLSIFIRQAVDREAAARFFLSEISHGDGAAVSQFLALWITLLEQVQPIICEDLKEATKQRVWERDNNSKCCVSGKPLKHHARDNVVYAHILSPSLIHHPDISGKEAQVRKIFAAFIGDDLLQSITSLMISSHLTSKTDCSEQVILLTKQAFDHFRNGRILLAAYPSPKKRTSIRYFVRTNLFILTTSFQKADHITFGSSGNDDTLFQMDLLLDAHRRFAEAFAWLEVSRHMKHASHLPYDLKSSGRINFLQRTLSDACTWAQYGLGALAPMFQPLWMKVPVPIRAFIYKRLAEYSVRFYIPTGSDRTIRLPFNLYLRIDTSDWASKHRAEFEALRLVQKWTRIPAPRGVDTLQHAGSSFLLMTGVPGTTIGRSLDLMTDEQLDVVVEDLQQYVTELRRIPNHTASTYQICNALGGGILDWRIGESQRRELNFPNESEFNDFLAFDLPIDGETSEKIAKSHGVKHEIVFTHADLNLRNILIDKKGKISGIVDWECAGWYPEYWECTKAHFTVRVTARWIMDVLDRVFPNYNNELEVEDMFAAMAPPW